MKLRQAKKILNEVYVQGYEVTKGEKEKKRFRGDTLLKARNRYGLWYRRHA